ncbi:MAG: hypothetical protein V2A79_14870 [Planctomycetota bacterium]
MIVLESQVKFSMTAPFVTEHDWCGKVCIHEQNPERGGVAVELSFAVAEKLAQDLLRAIKRARAVAAAKASVEEAVT